MKKPSLQKWLIDRFRQHPNEWIAKERIAESAKKHLNRTGETTGRRLRIMAEASQYGANPQSPCYQEQLKALERLDGAKIEVQGEKHSHYRYVPTKKTLTTYEVRGDRAVEVIREVIV